MLGICFLEKEEPQFAVRQFEQGLAVPGHDPEQYLGLHYHMATACERLDDLENAVKHLDEVYLVDAKFMDTVTRLKTLKAKVKKAHPKLKASVTAEAEARLDEILIEMPAPATAPIQEAQVPVPEPVPATAETIEAPPVPPEEVPAEEFLSSVNEMLKTAAEAPKPVSAAEVLEEMPPAEMPQPEAEVPPPSPEPEPASEPKVEKAPEPPAPEKPKPEAPKKRKISYV